MTERVVLVGLPGSGKTTVGSSLAANLGVAFIDVDDEFRTLTGVSAAEWLRREGEDSFRAIEEQALERALQTDSDAVVATGGGAVEYAGSRALLAREPLVVYLRCSPAVLLGRLEGGDRPLVEGPTEVRLGALAARRAPLYEEVAAIAVEADDSVEHVVAAVAALVVRA
jgi:shikimate kinase